MNSEKSQNIALIEFSERQHDIIYPQILLLNNLFENVFLWINTKTALDESLIEGKVCIQKVDFYNRKIRLNFIRNFNNISEKYSINNVILNNAQGIFVRDFILKFLFSKINIYGILHDTDKLKNSFTQKLISLKINKYFVLNDFVKDYCNKNFKNYKIESIYPCFINKKIRELLNEDSVKSDMITICIPGEIDQNRRDYKFLLNIISENKIPENIKFIFLGTAVDDKGFEIINYIKRNNLENKIRTFNEFIPEKLYYKTIFESDIIATLIHPGLKYYTSYKEAKISGAYLSALSFKKPLLLYEDFNKIEDFKDVSFFYNKNNFIDIINQIAKNKEIISIKERAYSKLHKLDLNYQIMNLKRALNC